jgi:hypothetical protein
MVLSPTHLDVVMDWSSDAMASLCHRQRYSHHLLVAKEVLLNVDGDSDHHSRGDEVR